MLLLISILTGCGGNDGNVNSQATGDTKQKTINGIAVPPVPNAIENNATLAGIDSNRNGVRDDVERDIATNVDNINDFNSTIRLAAAYQKFLTNPPKNKDDVMALYAEIKCAAQGRMGNIYSGDDGTFLIEKIFNTSDRLVTYQSARNFIGGFSASELPSCED